MAKIRDDLEGVVYLNDGRKLEAGDTVPADAVDELGDHVLASGGRKRPTTPTTGKKPADDKQVEEWLAAEKAWQDEQSNGAGQ